MGRPCEFSRVTVDYLDEFCKIFERMTCAMKSAELTDSISHNFIAQMIPHHMAAIEMSRNILQYTTNITLQNIADNIIKEQTESIANMCEIEKCCGLLENSKCELKHYQCRTNEILQAMFHGMKNARSTNCVNCNFMREMIPHHEGAVRMSENALRFDICDGLKPVLKAIISSQKRGICEMQNLMKCLECK